VTEVTRRVALATTSDEDGARRMRSLSPTKPAVAFRASEHANLRRGRLLQATRYLKDNRLLPRGFDKASENRGLA
jgi:hypothetical protein